MLKIRGFEIADQYQLKLFCDTHDFRLVKYIDSTTFQSAYAIVNKRKRIDITMEEYPELFN